MFLITFCLQVMFYSEKAISSSSSLWFMIEELHVNIGTKLSRNAELINIGPQFLQYMSSVKVSLPLNALYSRCEVESIVFTTPGDVSPVAKYDVGKLL